MKKVILWSFVIALAAVGTYLSNMDKTNEISTFLSANIEALAKGEDPEPPVKWGYEIVSYISDPPCYVAIAGPSPNDPPQLVKGRTPICNSVKNGSLSVCPSCMLG